MRTGMVRMTADRQERPAWEREDMQIRMDIGAWMAATGKQMGDLALMVGVSRGTMYNRYRHPGDFSLDEVRRIYRVIGKVIALSA